MAHLRAVDPGRVRGQLDHDGRHAPPLRLEDGKVIVVRSNLRCCSDGFEFTYWDDEVVRGAFLIDAHDREVIAWRAVANAGISGSDISDRRIEAVETRFGGCRASQPVEMPNDDGAPCTAKETRIFARQLGLKPCFTPVRGPQSNGIFGAFLRTLKRDHVQVTPRPEAGREPSSGGACRPSEPGARLRGWANGPLAGAAPSASGPGDGMSPSARRAARLPTTARDHPSRADAVVVARTEDALPALAAARVRADRLVAMVRNGIAGAPHERLAQAETSAIASFARRRRRRARAAVVERADRGPDQPPHDSRAPEVRSRQH